MKYRSKARVFSFIVILCMLLSALGVPTQNALAADAGTALQFDGTSTNKQHVSFGTASSLGVTTFTLESWVKRAAGGVTMSTGTLGLMDSMADQTVFILSSPKGWGKGNLRRRLT